MGSEGRSAEVIGGRYRVDAKLGEGGMGVVHQVWDQVTERAVALKCLTPAAAEQPVAVGLFEREFHTLKNLAHPHIVEVYDFGIDGVPYYTMELLVGTTANRLAPMPWQEACSVLRDVASALALIHSRRLVHRDVTVRNIHRAQDGTVKLIDFGGLAPMGVAKDRLGTPAFMAPEVLHQVALDQRTDLFSLGACAYNLLTGRHAFPARKMSALHDTWRTRPLPPSSITSSIPTELDQLVMSMLNLNAVARPVSAGIVITRLTALAGLPPQASDEAARSFLITPRLVGREREVGEFQGRITRAMQAQGSCLLVEAPPGMGRSRILDAFALEAQIAGAQVLRLDGGDGASDRETLAALRAGLRESLLEQPAPDDDQEATTLQVLRQVTRRHAVVIVADDVHQYGPASLALLGRLARLTDRQRLLLVVSYARPLPDAVVDAMRLLQERGDRTELRALDLLQTTDLLASCFDNAPNLKATAAFCHTVSAGRPGTCMALAQHLVDKGIAAYEDGVWALPESLLGHSLPESAEQLIEERLRRLDDDQRLWGQLLSLIPSAVTMSTADCVGLMGEHTSRARSHAAIEGLIAEQLVTSEGAITRVSQSSVRQAFLAALPESLARSLHRLLAEFFESRGDEMSLATAAYHLQQAGDREQAIRVINVYAKRLIAEMSEQEMARLALPFGEWGHTFEAALEFAEREGWPRRELYPIYAAIVTTAALSAPRWLSRGQPLFEYLKQDTSLAYWSPAELDALEAGAKVPKLKVVWRLLRATIRHVLAPRRSRGLNPLAALTLLGIYVTSALGACNITQTFHTGVPPLARALLPFRWLSPAIDLLYDLLVGAADAGRGLDVGWQRLQSVMQRLHGRVKGMPDIYRSTAHCILRYLDALERLAPLGDPRALQVAEWLEAQGGFGTHAWQLRILYHIYMGDGVSAERCRQKLETLAFSSARDNLSVTAGSKDVAQAHALSGDAPALRVTLESLEVTAERFPQWRGQLLVYRGEYARLVGNLAQAHDALQEALAFAPAGTNYSWAKAVPPYVEVLVRLGRVREAVEFGERAVAEAARLGIAAIYRRQIDMATALAWAAQGEYARAARRLDELLEAASEQGVRGVTMAVLDEARARVAKLSGDTPAFERACHGVARVFANHDNPALVARFRRLVDEAVKRDQRISARPPAPAHSPAQGAAEMRERIDHAVPGVRLRRALELLIKHCEADGGHLFVVRDTQVECVASAGEVVSTLELEDFVRSVRSMDDDLSVGVTAADLGLDDDVTRWCRWTSDAGANYDPVLLHASDGAGGAAVGIAILRPKDHMLRRPAPEFVRALVHALTETGDLPSAMPADVAHS